MLLTHVKGACSFEDLRTHEGTVHATNLAAVIAMGLLADDSEHDKLMDECATFQMPKVLRATFADTLLNCTVQDPYALWLRHEEHLCEDIVYRAQQVL